MYKYLLIFGFLMVVGLSKSQAQDTISVSTDISGFQSRFSQHDINTGNPNRAFARGQRGYIKHYFYRVGEEKDFKMVAYGKQLKKVVKNNQKAVKRINLYQTETIVELGLGLGAVASVIAVPLNVLNSANPQPLKIAIIGASLACISRTLHLIKGRHIKKAIAIYNEDLLQQEQKPKVGWQLNYKLEQMEQELIPGIGLGLQF